MSLGMENRELEEDLRKAAADGNEEAVTSMISNGINVNSQNSINGWLVATCMYLFMFICMRFIRDICIRHSKNSTL